MNCFHNYVSLNASNSYGVCHCLKEFVLLQFRIKYYRSRGNVQLESQNQIHMRSYLTALRQLAVTRKAGTLALVVGRWDSGSVICNCGAIYRLPCLLACYGRDVALLLLSKNIGPIDSKANTLFCFLFWGSASC